METKTSIAASGLENKDDNSESSSPVANTGAGNSNTDANITKAPVISATPHRIRNSEEKGKRVEGEGGSRSASQTDGHEVVEETRDGETSAERERLLTDVSAGPQAGFLQRLLGHVHRGFLNGGESDIESGTNDPLVSAELQLQGFLHRWFGGGPLAPTPEIGNAVDPINPVDPVAVAAPTVEKDGWTKFLEEFMEYVKGALGVMFLFVPARYLSKGSGTANDSKSAGSFVSAVDKNFPHIFLPLLVLYGGCYLARLWFKTGKVKMLVEAVAVLLGVLAVGVTSVYVGSGGEIAYMGSAIGVFVLLIIIAKCFDLRQGN